MATESVLAAMFSSPALNVIVLAMVFSLFPLPVAALKVATTLLLIFVIAPMIGKRQAPASGTTCPITVAPCTTWGQALVITAKSYAKSFWYVFRVGAPLMLVAAMLGALVAQTVPQQVWAAPVTLAGIVIVAMVATVLPVPMAFDVVIAYIAMSRGVPRPSWRAAAASLAAVALLGAMAGVAAIGLH